MKIDGESHGHARIFNLITNFPSAGAGAPTRITFEKLPAMMEGLDLTVLDIIIHLPKPTLTIAIGKALDGISLSQFVQTLTLRMSEGSPASESMGGDVLISGMDGPRALEMLHEMSGMPVFLGQGDSMFTLPAGLVAGATMPASGGVPTQQRNVGHLFNQGPYGNAASGAPTVWSDDVYIRLPVGHKRGETYGRNAAPAAWWSGSPGGCCGAGNPGYIEITLSPTIDNVAVAYAGGFDIEFVCLATEPENVPTPLLPKLRRIDIQSTVYSPDPGITAVLALMKPLLAGAQQTHNYTQVKLYRDGTEIIDDNCARNLRAIDCMQEPDREGFRYTFLENALSFAMTARFSRWGYPLVGWFASSVLAPGSAPSQLRIEIANTGEVGNHSFVHGYWSPITDAMRTKASSKEWSRKAAAGAAVSVIPATRNGNNILSSTIARIIPNKAIASKATGTKPVSVATVTK